MALTASESKEHVNRLKDFNDIKIYDVEFSTLLLVIY